VGRGKCELFVGGGTTSTTSVLLRHRYPLIVRGYLFTLNVGGLAVAWLCPTSTLIRSYPGEPGRSQPTTFSVAFSSAPSEPSHKLFGRTQPTLSLQ